MNEAVWQPSGWDSYLSVLEMLIPVSSVLSGGWICVFWHSSAECLTASLFEPDISSTKTDAYLHKPSRNHLCLLQGMWLSEVLMSLKVVHIFHWCLVWICRLCTLLLQQSNLWLSPAVMLCCSFDIFWGCVLCCRPWFKIHSCSVWLPPQTQIHDKQVLENVLATLCRGQKTVFPLLFVFAHAYAYFYVICLHLYTHVCTCEHLHVHHIPNLSAIISAGHFWLARFTWGKGCFTISNICNGWLMSDWANNLSHCWTCSAASCLSDEVGLYCQLAWQRLSFRFLSVRFWSCLPSSFCSWLFSYQLHSFSAV